MEPAATHHGRPPPGAQRLFFALWPDDARRDALASLQARVCPRGARLVPPRNLHMTLVFLGDCAPAVRDVLLEAAGRIEAPALSIELCRLGRFRGGALWSGPAAPVPVLEALARDLAALARAAGVAVERRRFHAHVTLARRVSAPPVGDEHEPITWPVRGFGLYASRRQADGPRYGCLARWPAG